MFTHFEIEDKILEQSRRCLQMRLHWTWRAYHTSRPGDV